MTKFLKDVKAKALTALAVGTCGVTAFAEGESNAIDLTSATSALSDMSTAVKDWIGTAAPYLVAILGAALAISLIWTAWKFVKKGQAKA